MQFTQYILNTLRSPIGIIEVRINRNNVNFDVPENESLRLTSNCLVFNTMGPIKKSLNDEEGFITCDQVQIALQDIWTFTGKINDLPTDQNSWTIDYSETAPDGGSLLSHIFYDESALYTVFVAATKPNGSTEILFAGDVNPLTIPREDQFVDKPDTDNEQQLQSWQLTLNNLSQRMKLFTVQDFVNGTSALGYTVSPITVAEVGDNLGNMAGLIPSDNGPYMANIVSLIDKPFWDEFLSDPSNNGPSYFDVAYYGRYYESFGDRPFPTGHWMISFGNLLTRVAKICNFSFNPTTDLTSSLLYWKPIYASNGYTPSATTAPLPKDIKVSYNYTFGIAPLDGSLITSPVTYAPTAPLSEIVKDIALQLGCFVTTEWDNATKRLRLRVLARHTNTGMLPSSWRQVKKGKEEPRSIGKRGVKVQIKGVEGSAVCPAGAGNNTINIELRWRTKTWGGDGPLGKVFPQSALILNKDKPLWDQDLSVRVEQTVEGSIRSHNPDSWILSSFLYANADYDENLKNKAYPLVFNVGASNTALMWCVHRTLSFQLCANPYFGPAQFYAREFVRNKIVYSREYSSCTDDNGNVGGVCINMQHNFKVRGYVRTFRAIELEIDVIKSKTKVKWMEIPPVDADDLDYSFEFIGEQKVSSGPASSNATGVSFANSFSGNGASSSNPSHLYKNPQTSLDNTIKTTVNGDVVSLRIEKGALQTGNLLEVRNENGIAWKIDASGVTSFETNVNINSLLTVTTISAQTGIFSASLSTATLSATSISASSVSSSTGIFNTSLLVPSVTNSSNGNAAATVDYVKSKVIGIDLTDFVTKSPSSEIEVTIIPTTQNTTSLVLQPKSTSNTTVDVLKINDKLGVNQITLQSEGGANFSGSVTVNNIVTKGSNIMSTIGDATVLKLKNSSTQSLPILEFTDNATNTTLYSINGINGEVYSRQGSYLGPNNSAAGGYSNRGILTLFMKSDYNSGKGLVLVGYGSQSSNVVEYRDSNNSSYFLINKDSTNGLRMRLGTGTPTAQVSIQDDLQFDPGNIQLTGTAQTWNDISANGKSYIRITTSGGTGHTLTSFSGGVEGKIFIIVNATGGNLILANQAAIGTTANRIITGTGANITLAADQNATLLYDGTTQRWRIIGRN